MRRTESGQGRARYTVRRPQWEAIGQAVLIRLCLANIGAVVGALTITQGWMQ